MSVIINWIDLPIEGASYRYTLFLPMGNLMVYQIANVITKTEWAFDSIKNEPLSENKQCDDLQQYLNNPNTQLDINLQKQGSCFRNKVWAEICKIPSGQVATYSELATTLNSGARAVANACRHNAFPGVIPCHRVVAKSGLGGYMGEISGKCMDIKLSLLEMESKS